MARAILYGYVFMFLILAPLDKAFGWGLFSDINYSINLFWAVVGILAICEAIQYRKTGGNSNVKS